MQLQNQILTNHNNNTAKNELRRMEVESQMKEWREGNELVQKQLDEQMDGVRSKFADVQVGLNYDVGLLEKKFETVPKVRWCNNILVRRMYGRKLQIKHGLEE